MEADTFSCIPFNRDKEMTLDDSAVRAIMTEDALPMHPDLRFKHGSSLLLQTIAVVQSSPTPVTMYFVIK